ncbi:hypothetical protein A9Q81_17355 [Gammaproteobacteria bacterium 42_54_T18]|nr:hypothetical protein A9Q81_17355 [Gammaproteobacteria bacterium 42_54_T18]
MKNDQPEQSAIIKKALKSIKNLQAELHATREEMHQPIAVIGMACRFPGASTPEEYWQNQVQEKNCVSEVPLSRWDWRDFYDENPSRVDKLNTKHGGFIENVDQFDADFFGISPKEANFLDPQQRILLEVTWETFENAGIIPSKIKGSSTGVFVALSAMDYMMLEAQQVSAEASSPYVATGCSFSTAAGRISYTFGFHGPALSIDTACSSSLVAMHQAAQSMRKGECNQAIVAGINILLTIEPNINFSKAQMLSPDGRCKTFSDDADGYVRGEGCGAVLLKPLSDAQRDGDNILAVLKGSAINQDGASAGLTVPYGPAQRDVIQQALKDARVPACDISYVEAHGTGTALGDPIEVKALGEVFSGNREKALVIGSVKTQIGHLEPAAGIASFIRTVMAMQNKTLPPHLHCDTLNTRIAWDDLNLKVAGSPEQWEATKNEDGTEVRRAGISSFGFSGTNSHVILEEYDRKSVEITHSTSPELTTATEKTEPKLLTLSAKSLSSLQQMAKDLLVTLSSDRAPSHSALANALNTKRSDFKHKIWWISDNLSETQKTLETIAQTDTNTDNVTESFRAANINYHYARAVGHNMAFMFTGQGSQWSGMGLDIYKQHPTFKNVIDRCADIYSSYSSTALTDIIFSDQHASPLNQTENTQPTLYAIEIALANTLMELGYKPDVVLGHSVGEYAAACVAGIFSIEDGMKMVCERGRLMQKLPESGSMMAVFTETATLKEIVDNTTLQIDIAAINSPGQVVVAGSDTDLDAFSKLLAKDTIKTKMLTVSHAFHSSLMEPMQEQFRDFLLQIEFSKPTLPLISNMTATWATNDIASADYWVDHVRAPVMFADSVAFLSNQSRHIVIEIGPQPTLTANAKQVLSESDNDNLQLIPTIKRDGKSWHDVLATIGECYSVGVPPLWNTLHSDSPRVRLPNYPFFRRRFWFSDNPQSQYEWHQARANGGLAGASEKSLLGQELSLAGDQEGSYYQNTICNRLPGYLEEHRVFDQVVFPAAGWLDILSTAAQKELGKNKLVQLKRVEIKQALFLTDQKISIQTVVEGNQITVYSSHIIKDEKRKWVPFVSAEFLEANSDTTINTVSVKDSETMSAETMSVEAFYSRLADESGLAYGQGFQCVSDVEFNIETGLSTALLSGGCGDCGMIDIGILDGALQTAGPIVKALENETYLPLSFDSVRFFDAKKLESTDDTTFRSHLSLELLKTGLYKGNILITDKDNKPLLELLGLRLIPTPHSILMSNKDTDTNDLYYHNEWVEPEKISDKKTAHDNQSNHDNVWWLILNTEGLANALSLLPQQLENEGVKVRIVPQDTLSSVLKEESPLPSKILLFLESCDNLDITGSISSIENSVSQLKLLQNRFSRNEINLVPLIGKGSNKVGSYLQAAPLFDAQRLFIRTVANEQDNWNSQFIEYSQSEESVKTLVKLLITPLNEKQLRINDENVLVERLIPGIESDRKQREITPLPNAEAYKLQLSDFGSFEQLTLVGDEISLPKKDEVCVEIQASALNFKDVLFTLGALNEYLEQQGITDAKDLPLGYEGAGIVKHAGKNVTNIQIGDKVIVSATGCLASHVTVPSATVSIMPETLSFVEAAALPTVYMTAIYALLELAKLKSGDKVLIHAAAGGVGQAAIQIAKAQGAEIFATASPRKWFFLRSQGITHIYNSRDTDFSQAILDDTNGNGIDVILNSLNGDFIPAALNALTDKGRFVEIGKIGVWSDEQVSELRPNAKYWSFDLADSATQNPELYAELQRLLWQGFNENRFNALPVETFSVQQAATALRHLSQAKNLGKVVLTMPTRHEKAVNEKKSYLITGASGSIGSSLIDWLCEHGAKSIVLVSRSKPENVLHRVAQHQKRGTNVVWVTGDVSDAQVITQCISEASQLAPLGGIFHAAGVIKDAIFQRLEWADFETVWRPKVTSAWLLHKATEHLNLDHFVLFSSMAAIMGGPGQSNYASANAMLDGLAKLRRQQGLSALSINWGPWQASESSGGMVSTSDIDLEKYFETVGIHPVSVQKSFDKMEAVMLNPPMSGVVSVMSVNWNKALTHQSDPMSFFDHILQQEAFQNENKSITRGDLLKSLSELDEDQRKLALQTEIQQQLAMVMGFENGDLPELDTGFFEMGIDSLMAVEFKGSLEQKLDIKLPATLLMEVPTIGDLVQELCIRISTRLAEEEDELLIMADLLDEFEDETT